MKLDVRSGLLARSSCLLAVLGGSAAIVGCANNSVTSGVFAPYFVTTGSAVTDTTTDTTTDGSLFDTGSRVNLDPCDESNARKFVTISLRNDNDLDHIHYFLILVAFVNGDVYPDGAVCPDDVGLYRSFGYQEVTEGQSRSFGNYCIEGPALVYFHENGSFVSGSGFAAAIPPAQGQIPTFDDEFTSSGLLTPVPNQIIWHNPGFGGGAQLNTSVLPVEACNIIDTALITAVCSQDAFYYVDETDQPAGTISLGQGSAIRTGSDIQGTDCQAGFGNFSGSQLAPSSASASDALDNEFLRGGFIEYVFIRNDTQPPIPQLVWRVTDSAGAIAQDFDPRSGVN